MEKEIKINIPEGYDDAVFDNETKTVKFIKKAKKLVKSWFGYCKKHKYGHYEPWIYRAYNPCYDNFVCNTALESMSDADKAKMETLAKLIMLHDEWVGDWKPDWDNFAKTKYCITNSNYGDVTVLEFFNMEKAMAFPTRAMAEEFMDCFKYLLKDVKMFL